MKVTVINAEGKSNGELNLAFEPSDTVESKEHLYYLVNNYQMNFVRRGTASTKRRAEVSGGGKKPYKQKGTGNARRGTSRTPLRPGGGVVWGPKPRSFKTELNKDTIKLAFQLVFNDKSSVLKVIKLDVTNEIKTKHFVSLFNILNVDSNISLIADATSNEAISCKNLSNCNILDPAFLSIEKLLNSNCILMTEDAFNKVQELYSR